MFVVINREPKPDAAYWPGRRFFAAIDAVVWPFALALLILQLPNSEGLVRPAVAIATLCAFFRVLSAVLVNHRYRFTTWWCMRGVALLMLVGAVLKLAMPA